MHGSSVHVRGDSTLIIMVLLSLLMLNARVVADWGYEEIDYTMAILNTSYPGSVERPDELGKFSEGHVGAASGLLVHVQSVNSTTDHACTLPLRAVGGQALPHNGEPWIALIRRGQCSYEQKVDNAYKSNASAVLIFNDRESTVLQKMKVNTHRDISAVFTSQGVGEKLAKLVDNGTKVMLGISVGSFGSRPYSSLNRTSVLFVSISFIVLMVISLTWLVFYYIQRFRYFHAKDRLARRLCSAAKKALSKIPTKNIRSEDKELQGEGECCAVCIEPYRISDVLRILPCRHEFHKPCIDPWLLEHRTCPMCKMDILKFYGYNFAGSQESILHIDMDDGGLGDSESVSTTPSPEPPPEFSGGHRGSVGTITVSTSTPYGHRDPQVGGGFSELLTPSNASQTAAYDSVYLAASTPKANETPVPCVVETKHEKQNKAKKCNDQEVLESKCSPGEDSTTAAAVEARTPADEVPAMKCSCPCSCNNSLVTPVAPDCSVPAESSSSTPADRSSKSPESSPSKQRRKGNDELS